MFKVNLPKTKDRNIEMFSMDAILKDLDMSKYKIGQIFSNVCIEGEYLVVINERDLLLVDGTSEEYPEVLFVSYDASWMDEDMLTTKTWILRDDIELSLDFKFS